MITSFNSEVIFSLSQDQDHLIEEVTDLPILCRQGAGDERPRRSRLVQLVGAQGTPYVWT